MSSTGFVNQAFCDMVNWQWYRDMTVNCLFLHLLRIVNKSDKMELGISVKSGSVLISYSSLASFFKLTKKQIIYALEKLESSHDISIKNMHRQGAIVTITEWNKYNGFNAINENANNTQSRDNGEKLSQKCNNQESVNKEVTTLNKNNLSQNCHINGTKQAESDEFVTKLSQNCHNQNANTEHVTNQDEKSLSQECSINSSIQSSQEPENKESSPTPLKENKEEEKENPFEKEEKIKEEKSSTAISEQDTKKTRRKPVYTVTYSIETGTFSGITENDKEMWHKTYPNIDIDNEIMKAACWLYSNYDKNKSNYKSFLNKWFNKAQRDAESQHAFIPFPEQHPFVTLPNTVDDVMAKIQEQKLAMSREEAEKFFHHYKALGWKKNGNPVYDWTELLRLWQANIAKFERNRGTQQLLPLEETPLEKALREFNDE